MFLMPSGHNTQPWKFRIADNAIMIEDILFYQIEKIAASAAAQSGKGELSRFY